MFKNIYRWLEDWATSWGRSFPGQLEFINLHKSSYKILHLAIFCRVLEIKHCHDASDVAFSYSFAILNIFPSSPLFHSQTHGRCVELLFRSAAWNILEFQSSHQSYWTNSVVANVKTIKPHPFWSLQSYCIILTHCIGILYSYYVWVDHHLHLQNFDHLKTRTQGE